jgi:hypothetical protein
MSPIRLPYLAILLGAGALLSAGCSTSSTGGGSGTTVSDTSTTSDGSVVGDGKSPVDTVNDDVAKPDSSGDTGKVEDSAVGDAVTDATADDAAQPDGSAGEIDTAADAGPADVDPGVGSCAGNCGSYLFNSDCHCDAYCVESGDCCADYEALCTCKADADCDTGDKCKPGVCVLGMCDSNDLDCGDDNYCTADSCDSATGKCSNVPEADGTECDPAVECKVGECKASKCNVAGPAADGDLCADGNPCTDSDGCVAGSCVGGGPADCDDTDECTADSCDPGSGCLHKALPATTICDDGETCTVNDLCTVNGCEGTGQPDGTPCDDGESCTTGDACDTGLCWGKDAADGAPCDDGDACTSNDSCSWGYCNGDSQACDDKNDCTFDKCDSKTGACAYETEAEGSWCSDDNPCTSNEGCVSGQCVGTDDSGACDDGNPCTADKCDGANGAKNCSHAAIGEGSTCDDSDLCTINDVCTSGACVGKGGSCTTSYSDAFDCASTSSWSLSAAAGSFKSAWAIDGTPNPPQPKSGACSLNFNNGTNFDDNVAVDGTATSPSIALPATGKVRLSFWSWHDTELSSNYDTRTVAVSADQFSSTPVQKQLENGDPGQQWLFQTIDLTALAGKSVQIRFSFDSIDAANNAGAGWFIDDVKIDVLP